MVRISDTLPGGPGSIPGVGTSSDPYTIERFIIEVALFITSSPILITFDHCDKNMLFTYGHETGLYLSINVKVESFVS